MNVYIECEYHFLCYPGFIPEPLSLDKQALFCIPSPLSFTSEILLHAIHFLGKGFCLSFCLFQLRYQNPTIQNIYNFFPGTFVNFTKSMFLGGNTWFTFSCEDLIFNRNILACYKLKPPVAESSFLFCSNINLFKHVIRLISQYAFKHWN